MQRQPKWLRALGNTADAVFIVDAAQRIIFWNKGTQRLLGYSPAQVLRRPCHQIIAGRVQDKAWCRADCKVHRCVQRGIPVQNFDLLTATREGKDLWVNVSIIALPRKQQPLTLHLLRDVSRQERTQEALAHIFSTLRLYGLAPDLPASPQQPAPRILAGLAPRILAGPPHSFPSAPPGALPNLLSTLTRREVEVLGLLAEGLSTSAIAARLNISHLTVRNHIRNTLRKTGLHSQAQAVSLAVRNNLV